MKALVLGLTIFTAGCSAGFDERFATGMATSQPRRSATPMLDRMETPQPMQCRQVLVDNTWKTVCF